MSDHEHVLKAPKDPGPWAPQVRVYLLSQERPCVAALVGALPDYEVVLPRSKNEIAFIRKLTKEQFRVQCERAASIMAPLLVSDSYLGCVYDDGGGESQFRMELWKTGESQKFIETDPTSDLGR